MVYNITVLGKFFSFSQSNPEGQYGGRGTSKGRKGNEQREEGGCSTSTNFKVKKIIALAQAKRVVIDHCHLHNLKVVPRLLVHREVRMHSANLPLHKV